MNTHELPMILFTVLTQASVGAFIVLGVINVAGRMLGGYSAAVLDEVSDPASWGVGGALVLGLLASMLHMNDPFHVLNVFRHLDSSWLSREIVTGMAFAACGFLYTICQWRSLGAPVVRRVLALVTAGIGVLFVVSMSMVYYTLVTVPAWHTWVTPARFFTTALLLGAFAVGAAFMTTVMLRTRGAFGGRLGAREYSPEAMALILASLRGIAVGAIALLAFQFVLQSVHLGDLAAQGAIGAAGAAALSGGWGVTRIVLVCAGAGLLSLVLYRIASDPSARPRLVAGIVTVAFVCVFIAEFIGRAGFYEQMQRVGM